MDFLDNIKKEFILTTKKSFVKDNFYIFSKADVDTGIVKAKVNDISMNGVTFSVTKVEKLDEVAKQAAELMSVELERKVNKYKRTAKKVIKAWEDSPEKFKKQTDRFDNPIYKRVGLLKDSEYHHHVHVSFDRLTYFTDFGFSTGCGGDTFYSKEEIQKKLDDIESWLESAKKELSSAKIHKRIKNYILKSEVHVPLSKIKESVELPSSMPKLKIPRRNSKPKFPVKFTASGLNAFLNDNSNEYIDDEFLSNYTKEEMETYFGVDITKLIGWEVVVENEGYHHTDGQMCDYTATFIHPDGHEYKVYDTHCLITGWNISRDEEAVVE